MAKGEVVRWICWHPENYDTFAHRHRSVAMRQAWYWGCSHLHRIWCWKDMHRAGWRCTTITLGGEDDAG